LYYDNNDETNVIKLENKELKKNLKDCMTKIEELIDEVNGFKLENKLKNLVMSNFSKEHTMSFEDKLECFNKLEDFKIEYKIDKTKVSTINFQLSNIFYEYTNGGSQRVYLSNDYIQSDYKLIELLKRLLFKYSDELIFNYNNISLESGQYKKIEVVDVFKTNTSSKCCDKTRLSFKLLIKPEFWTIIDNTEIVVIQFLKTIYWKSLTYDKQASYALDNLLYV